MSLKAAGGLKGLRTSFKNASVPVVVRSVHNWQRMDVDGSFENLGEVEPQYANFPRKKVLCVNKSPMRAFVGYPYMQYLLRAQS